MKRAVAYRSARCTVPHVIEHSIDDDATVRTTLPISNDRSIAPTDESTTSRRSRKIETVDLAFAIEPVSDGDQVVIVVGTRRRRFARANGPRRTCKRRTGRRIRRSFPRVRSIFLTRVEVYIS